MALRDKIAIGNGQEIIQTSYRIIDAIQHSPKHQQVQAVAAVFLAIINEFKLKPWELLEIVGKILRDEETFTTAQALFAYIKEEIGRG